MSTAARRLVAVARGYCTSCLARPARPGRAQCEVCCARNRDSNRRKLRPITVPAHTHALLCAISRRRGITLGQAVALVLADVAVPFIWRGIARPNRPLADHEVHAPLSDRAPGQQATSSRQSHPTASPPLRARESAERRPAQAKGRQ